MTKTELFDIKIEELDSYVYGKCKLKWDLLAKPIDGFGDFEDAISKIAAIQGTANPDISKRAVVIFCADNGIVEEGVSQCGPEVTRKVAENLGAGKSTVCVLGKKIRVNIYPIDIGIKGTEKIEGVLDRKVCEGTKNFLEEPAMSEEEVLKAIVTGMNLARDLKYAGYTILASGEMGIGNTTTSTALLSTLMYIQPHNLTGRGAGLDDAGLERKRNVIKQGIRKYSDGFGKDDLYLNAVYRSNVSGIFEKNVAGLKTKEYALHILSSLGGLDIAGLVGLMIGGAMYRIPIVLDGLITGAAAVCAELIVPGVKDFLIPSHKGKENGNEQALEYLGLKPYINGNMALGEGTGAVMLFPLLDAIIEYYRNGSDFDSYDMEAYKRY
ncbi:MAG: nicotinate-nucleotide--dimethylbenzimidazole phosphoribosyltransferase [Eubacterium sp.]|nr:nicotinate-nucleotide--dimethylbenzimidazole phosphoribosyltransferase [Eubacterium sp.]